MNQLTIAILLFFAGQTLIWVQTNGQFLWKWFDKNPLFLSIVFGTIISYMFIYATKHVVGYFDGLLWPARFVGFSIGITTYVLGVAYFFKQGITPKTLVSLILCFILISIQVLWTETK